MDSSKSGPDHDSQKLSLGANTALPPTTQNLAALPFEQRRRERSSQERDEDKMNPATSTPLNSEATEPNPNKKSTSSNDDDPASNKPASSSAGLVDHPLRHTRGVSWGGVEELNPQAPYMRASPTAQEAYEAAEMAFAEHNNDGHGGGMHIKGLSSGGQIRFDDLMQFRPVESEAESHILRALERKDLAEGDDGIIRGEVLLGNVPEGAEAIFNSTPSEQDGESFDPNGTRRDRFLSVGTYGDDNDDDNRSIGGSVLFTTPAVDDIWGKNRDDDMAGTLHSGNTTNHHTERRHQRQKTMQETLFSLTYALDDLYQQNRPRAGTVDSKPLPSVNHAVNVPLDSSADNLVQNVSQLFRHHKRAKSTGTDQPSTATEVEPLVTMSDVDPDISIGAASQSAADESQSRISGGPVVDKSQRRKTWAALKDAIIQNGPEAAARTFSPESPPSTATMDKGGTGANGDIELGESPSNLPPHPSVAPGKQVRPKKTFWCRPLMEKFTLARDINVFLEPRRRSICLFFTTIFSAVIPSLGIACILFYLAGNPNTGRVNANKPRSPGEEETASISWWILFLGVRQLVTLSLARFLELFVVDFVCLERRWSLKCVGPTVTLLLVQAKGWPCLLFFWSLCDLALLSGDSEFANHWGYWQDWLGIFNENNPSGKIPSKELNLRILLIALGVSCAVAIKRLLMGFHQGRKIFNYYAEDLAKLMKKILLVSQVAALAVQLERERIVYGEEHVTANVRASRLGIDEVIEEEAGVHGRDDDDDTKSNISGDVSQPSAQKSLLIAKGESEASPLLLSHAQKERIERVLGNWEEPEPDVAFSKNISVGSILQFRTSMTQLGRPFPFSFAFGRASTREECIESAQNVFLRLLAEVPGETSLSFNVLALAALQSDGTLVQEKIRDLLRVFRPNRSGNLTLVDFCKSVDRVYKELRLLRASVRNSQKIDRSFEHIFNVVFYTVLLCFCLALLGFDPLALFLSLSSFALAFSFMISRASSNYFEGLLFILCHRPYDIGDRIVVQAPQAETSWQGTTDWIVKDIDLMKTTIVYAYTNEVATVSNGALAMCRIMNAARSPSAYLYVILRFGIDVTFGQIEIFREALTRYVEARPRDWKKMWCLRALNVQADEGYVEYMVSVEARDTWQELDNLWHIRGMIKAFCHELAKQLDMRYTSPAMPIDLRMRGSLSDALKEDEDRRQNLTKEMTVESEFIQSIIRDRTR